MRLYTFPQCPQFLLWERDDKKDEFSIYIDIAYNSLIYKELRPPLSAVHLYALKTWQWPHIAFDGTFLCSAKKETVIIMFASDDVNS